MKPSEEYILPWVKNAEPYSDRHMDIAWENPEIIRMMSNENLLSPSQKVLDAILEAARKAIFTPARGRSCVRNWVNERV